MGDFNSYTQEDPMQVLYQAGYVNQASDDPKDVSYEFGSTAGSLDHVLASPAAAGMVTGRDVWQINAEESVGFEYSRYNYNATLLYQPNQFRASDHNPELVGLSAPFTQEASTVSVTATPDRIRKKKDTTRIDVTVSGAAGHAHRHGGDPGRRRAARRPTAGRRARERDRRAVPPGRHGDRPGALPR